MFAQLCVGLLIIIVIVVSLLVDSIRVVQEFQKGVVFRFAGRRRADGCRSRPQEGCAGSEADEIWRLLSLSGRGSGDPSFRPVLVRQHESPATNRVVT